MESNSSNISSECKCGKSGSGETNKSGCENPGNSSSSQSQTSGRVSPSLIQIKATSDEEVRRRIQAFMQNKRNEIDERNIREFISPTSTDRDGSCARVEAVYVHREGGCGHIRLKRVENLSGPQTQQSHDTDNRGAVSSRLPVSVQRAEAIEERLANMEEHMALNSDHLDVFSRIKNLEKRISFLEGLSPEYFTNGKAPNSDNKKQSSAKTEAARKPYSFQQPESLTDINKRIKFLKEVLKQKVR